MHGLAHPPPPHNIPLQYSGWPGKQGIFQKLDPGGQLVGLLKLSTGGFPTTLNNKMAHRSSSVSQVTADGFHFRQIQMLVSRCRGTIRDFFLSFLNFDRMVIAVPSKSFCFSFINKEHIERIKSNNCLQLPCIHLLGNFDNWLWKRSNLPINIGLWITKLNSKYLWGQEWITTKTDKASVPIKKQIFYKDTLLQASEIYFICLALDSKVFFYMYQVSVFVHTNYANSSLPGNIVADWSCDSICLTHSNFHVQSSASFLNGIRHFMMGKVYMGL